MGPLEELIKSHDAMRIAKDVARRIARDDKVQTSTVRVALEYERDRYDCSDLLNECLGQAVSEQLKALTERALEIAQKRHRDKARLANAAFCTMVSEALS